MGQGLHGSVGAPWRGDVGQRLSFSAEAASYRLRFAAAMGDMFGPGLRNPQRSVIICVVVTLAAWGFVAWGAFEMHQAGEETLGSGLKIGLALLPAILGPFMILNFRLGMKVFAAIRRGEDEIGRGAVTAAELAEFAANDSALAWPPVRLPTSVAGAKPRAVRWMRGA